MIAFEVYVNEVKVCTAGLGELNSIIAMLMCTVNPDKRPDEPRVMFSVVGVDDKMPHSWVQYDLLVGNRIEIRVVNTEKTDPPTESTCPGGSCPG